MGSRGKKKTTFEKLARESRLREKRLDKAARKEARKQAAENGTTQPEHISESEMAEPVAAAEER
jgi:hypothetical protein